MNKVIPQRTKCLVWIWEEGRMARWNTCLQEVILSQTLTIRGRRDGVETKGRASGLKSVPKGDRWGCTREKRRPRVPLPFYKQKMCMSGFLFNHQKAWEPLHGISHTSNIDNWENTKTKRLCDMHAHSSTIHSSRKVETPKRPSRNERSSKTVCLSIHQTVTQP